MNVAKCIFKHCMNYRLKAIARISIHKIKVVLTIFQYTSIAILIMAWINYVNLAISSNRKRMREVAIRRTIGGKYADFIFQFMTEAMAVNIIAVALAFSIIQGIRTPMEVLFAFYIPEYDTIALSTQVMLFGAFIVGVLFTGFYPAIVSLKQSPVSLFGFQKLRNKRIASVFHLPPFNIASLYPLWCWLILFGNKWSSFSTETSGLTQRKPW